MIAGRLKGLTGAGDGDERRVAPRIPERREMRVLFSVAAADGGSGPLSVSGHTRDISSTGLALLLSSPQVGGRDLSSGERPMLIELELPSGPVRFQAIPVRSEKVGEEEGYLIGVRIMGMSEDARERFEEFLREARRM
jgi:hypothetical protein